MGGAPLNPRQCQRWGCPAVLRSDNVSGYCRRHRPKNEAGRERRRLMGRLAKRRRYWKHRFTKTCSACSAYLSPDNKTGMCRTCWDARRSALKRPRAECLHEYKCRWWQRKKLTKIGWAMDLNTHQTEYVAWLVRMIENEGVCPECEHRMEDHRSSRDRKTFVTRFHCRALGCRCGQPGFRKARSRAHAGGATP